jgi:hypothetical protein
MRNSRNSGLWLNRQRLLAVREHHLEQLVGALAGEEVLLVGRLFVGVAGADHHALDAEVHHGRRRSARTALGSAPSKSVVLVVTRKPLPDGLANGRRGHVVDALAADGEVVVSCPPSMWIEKVRYLLGWNQPSSSFSFSRMALVQR